MRKLTEVELFYIEGHRDLPVKELAKILGVTVPQVKTVLKNLPDKLQEPPKTSTTPAMAALDKIEGRGTIVMTKAGSEIADTVAKPREQKPLPEGVGRFRDV